jgi:predicted alpha/beta hydrolase
MEAKIERIKVSARDGMALGATVYFTAKADEDGPVVLIAPAAAVKRTYYDKFARYVASSGWRAVTFDFRGIGDSRPAKLVGFRASMAAWGSQDLPGVIDWIVGRLRPSRLFLVGHSAGGHVLGLAPNGNVLSAAFLVASCSGYWGLWEGMHRLRMFAIWHLLMPALAGLCGYFPGSKVGLGEDLPANMAREWARWGRHPDFLLGYENRAGYESLAIPMLFLSIKDDTMAIRRAVDSAASWYTKALIERQHLDPREIGADPIGHFGFFREKFRDTLWPRALKWLEGHAVRAGGHPTWPGPSSPLAVLSDARVVAPDAAEEDRC